MYVIIMLRTFINSVSKNLNKETSVRNEEDDGKDHGRGTGVEN